MERLCDFEVGMGSDDNWSVRKTIGFKSEQQYERYKKAGERRGLTVAQFLSWMAEAFIKSEGQDVDDVQQSDDLGMGKTHIRVVCSKRERSSIKKLAHDKGVSMGQLLLLSLKPKDKKKTDYSGMLAVLAMCEYHIEFEDLESAKEQLKVLRSLLDTNNASDIDGCD